MSKEFFRTALFLPAQAAAETEATITSWHVSDGDSFTKGQVLASVESAKTSFEFEAPCDGTVVRVLVLQGGTVAFESPVVEIETSDRSMKKNKPGAPAVTPESHDEEMVPVEKVHIPEKPTPEICLLGIGTYLPERVVKNAELLKEFPDITEEYIFGVTGIRERRWAGRGEKPSDMALAASKIAIERSGLTVADIGGIIVSTTTPDVVMPATSCILQEKLGIRGVPSFDLNAACAGWLYSITVAKALILAGTADNILVVAVDMESRVLDKKDRNTYFLFGDGSGATVVSGSRKGHVIKKDLLLADSHGLHMARREQPGYEVHSNNPDVDPWIRLDGKALFRFATESFSFLVRELVTRSGWDSSHVRWVVPHQANGRIIKAAAQKSGIPFERFYLNIDRVGNTSSASIPIALSEIEKGIQKGDRLIFCTVGAGITAAALSLEW